MALEDMKSFPHIIKPFSLALSIIFLIFVCIDPSRSFLWFAILVGVVQLLVCLGVFILYVLDTAVLITMDIWPIIEMSYSAVFVVCHLLNLVIFIGGLFYYFDFLILLSIGLTVILGLTFGLNVLITWKARSIPSANQATASPGSYPGGINPGV